MIKHKWIDAIVAFLIVAAVLVIGLIYVNPAFISEGSKAIEAEYVAAMDKTQIMEIQLIVDERQWAHMLENATEEEYIPATVIINGSKIDNVGIRPKGNSSLRTVAQDDTSDRYSFKIEFDHYIAGQTCLGLDKIVLNNMQGDATYMKEYLSYDIMEYIGVHSPLYAFADISLNGETWGFYLAVESLEDSYAQRIYGSNHGEMYKPESMGVRGEENSPSAFNRPEEGPGKEAMGGMASKGVSLQYIDDEISSYSSIFDNSVFDTNESDHMRVVQALKKLSYGEELESTIDIEAVLKYFAAHTVLVSLDSYVSNMGHNYYLYEEDGQLSILPWDYNLAFGGFQSGNASDVVNYPIDTPVSGVSLEDRPLLGKLLELPVYMEMYHSYLQEIVDHYFNSGLFEQTVSAVNALISSYVEADPTAFYDYDAYILGVSELTKLGLLRAESIEGQLKGTIPSTSSGQNADPDKCIDASDIDLSLLGGQGGAHPEQTKDMPQEGFGGMGDRHREADSALE